MPKNIKTGLIVIIVLATLGYLSFKLYASGFRFFNPWESIGSPPEEIKKLVGIEIDSYPGGNIYRGRATKIYVLSGTGKIFSCCKKQNNAWVEEDTDKSNEDIFRDCGDFGKSTAYHFPDELSRRTMTWCGESDYGKIIYVLHSDGTVSYSKEFRNSFIFGFALCFFVPLGITLSFVAIFILDRTLSFIRRRSSTIITT